MPQLSELGLSAADRRELLSLARQAITEVVCRNTLPDLLLPSSRLARMQGAFVTLRVDGRLRGCIGRAEPETDLADTVIQSAIAAAFDDRRFNPLTPGELSRLEIEISVLSGFQRLYLDQIQVGTHGLLVRCGQNRGLLLPQVAVERSWLSRQFLQQACKKAGLPPDAWREAGTEVFGFTAEVFSDQRAAGPNQ